MGFSIVFASYGVAQFMEMLRYLWMIFQWTYHLEWIFPLPNWLLEGESGMDQNHSEYGYYMILLDMDPIFLPWKPQILVISIPGPDFVAYTHSSKCNFIGPVVKQVQ